MAVTIQLHIANEEPVVAEVEALPDASTTIIIANNPRMRDGKDLRYALANVTTIIYPISRIAFIQVLPSGEEEKIVGFVRE
jgi:hypothetical protein